MAARAGPGCELVTVVGSAGVGKSRLVAEFLAAVDATVVRGRCLSYGDGITYWPVVEVLTALAGRDARSSSTRSRLYERKGNLVMAAHTRSRLAELTASRQPRRTEGAHSTAPPRLREAAS